MEDTTARQPTHAAKVSTSRVDGGEPRPGPGIWHSRQQRRWCLQKDWKEQPHGHKGEEPTLLDASKMMTEGEASLLLETLEGEPKSAESAPLVVPESKETALTDVSTRVPERPVRGRAAREQLLRDIGG